ncbi:helix-turn-helix domain-containing protein [Micromonospora sp. WP24]|uniref:helix-turn-helix transcriptional regulator n=1 Tax=Micromonospora sp. WP24 TaxID=2604469 RepID=UPI0011DC4E41|nr:helix-turn-helix transcriptional regulator [Micromonospora sp. WP24]TYC05150.1 helix-turn-helix domain-containing protein [Micromonospora sp. WP24]
MHSDQLAHFLRARRAALEPGELGLARRSRRRTPGLRREEVAELAAMSTDYYRRLEQGRSAPPSPQILDALARALRLNEDERDYLYRIADREPPRGTRAAEEMGPALRQLVESLGDSPAQVMTLMSETLMQNRAAVALLGKQTGYTGDMRYSTYRWFTDPSTRWMHPQEEHEEESRARIAELRARAASTRSPEADRLIGTLRARSPEFERLWLEQKVAVCRSGTKTMAHPHVGRLDLQCQILRHEGMGHVLVTFTAAPDSPAAHRLRTITDGSPV